MKKCLGVMFSVILAASMISACSGTNSSSSSPQDSAPAETSQKNQEEKAFVPERDFEFVVPASPGGGSDTTARLIAQIMKEKQFVDKDIQVVNKPGGSSAVGNSYTYSKKGDPYTVMTWVPAQQASAVLNKADVTLEKLTPLATIALDSILVVVDADGPYKTFEDLAKAAKEKPDQITIGGTALGGDDHLVLHLINKHAGTKFKYVSFNGAGESVSALLGGHVNAILANPNEIIAQIEGGEAAALATTAEERLTSPLDQVPTFAELGYPDVHLIMFRGMVGPPDMPAEAVKYWEDMFKKVTETQEWEENYLKKFNLQRMYKNAADSKTYFEESLQQFLQVHSELESTK